MIKVRTAALRSLGCSVSALAMLAAAPVWAQVGDTEDVAQSDGNCDTDENGTALPGDPDCVDIASPGPSAGPGDGAIVVTGSRVKRPTYSAISPIQVITTESSQDAGLFDPAQILQRDEAASGTQIDSTFTGFVLDNGPGAQTLNLRGLGDNRTLVLINGRRLAPSGVEGAPVAASINLLPSSLVERYELLLDGASSVYGSDAIAGVANVILRKDFDGLELFASGSLNPQGGGDDYQVAASYGINFDRGFIGIGAEYDYRDAVKLRDRDFLRGCDTHLEITQGGQIRRVGLADQINALRFSGGTITTSASECKRTGLSGRIFEAYGAFGSIYFTPGGSNVGVPNFSESNDFFGVPVDANGDGLQDIDFQDYNTNGGNLDAELIPQQKRYNVAAYGEYTLPGAANITPFFEALYSRVDIQSNNTGETQIFPSVPDDNPFNPCNPFQPNGVDCFQLGYDFNGFGTFFGVPTSQTVIPLFSIRGDRDNFAVKQEQYRGVLGVRGDMPFAGPSWTFEVSGMYSRAEGKSRRRGIREDKLAFAIGVDPTLDYNGDGIADNDTDANFDGIPDNPGNGVADEYDFNENFGTGLISQLVGDRPSITPCDASMLANPDLVAPDLLQGCVPVNLFAPSVLGSTVGTFATQAETDYLFGVRDFTTTYEQIVLNGFVTGTVFDLPAGPVSLVAGLEWREDKINSIPNLVASDGLLFGFFSDRGAVGSKWIREAFTELDIPLMANSPVAEELNLNLAGRVTDEEFYGTNFTYSGKLNWRPISPLLLRATYGTSFRAPNLRENFLRGQTGFPTVLDPCAVPPGAFVGGVYNPTLDMRDPTTLANCVREGRDPTTVGITLLGNSSVNTVSVESSTIGSLALRPEESSTWTLGATFEERFGDDWNLSLAATYYSTKIDDSIIEPSVQFAVNDCFTRQDGIRSQFCDQLFINQTPSNLGLISTARLGFLNISSNKVRGIDLNAELGKDVTMFGKRVGLGVELRANHLIERSTTFIDSNDVVTFDDAAGRFGLPDWTGRGTFTAEVDNWTLTWQVRYIGDQTQDILGVDAFSDAFGNGPDGNPTGFIADTCTGNGDPAGVVPGDGVFCRDVGFTKDYFEHAASIRYRTDRWEARVGVTNIFDRSPPEVDSNEGAGEYNTVSNIPIGGGFNLDGREFFASMKYKF